MRIAGLLIALSLMVPATARADAIQVTSFGDDDATGVTLRDAVAAATANGGGDTIVLPAGEYTLTQGPIHITRSMTITGPATAQPTATVNLPQTSRGFDVSADQKDVTIAHLRLYGGQAADSDAGTAAVLRGGTLTLDHDILDSQCCNGLGGALTLFGGVLTMTDSEVIHAHAFAGGGLYLHAGTAVIHSSLFADDGHNSGDGGAINNSGGFLEVYDSTFFGNQSKSGHGGAIFAGSSTTVRNSTFEGNVAGGNQGGGSAIWGGTNVQTYNVLYGPPAGGDNCATTAQPTDHGGSLDAGASCHLPADHSNQALLLGPLALNGGASRSFLPYAGFPGLDTGVVPCTTTDQRDLPRNDGHCDVGALEGVAASGPRPPAVSYSDPQDTTDNNVFVNPQVDRFGLPTSYTVEYGTTTAYGATIGGPFDAGWGEGAGPQPLTTFLSELLPGTTYHYRAVATSAGGTTYGADATFSTAGPPQPATQAADVAATSLTLRGLLNPGGYVTTYWFEWGTDTGYGNRTPSQTVDQGLTAVPVSFQLTGLTTGVPIHYRLVAANEYVDDPVLGPDMTATPAVQVLPQPSPTPSPTPTPTPTPPAPVFQKTVVAAPISGKVLVRRPGSKTFVELDATAGIPNGSTIDTRHGVIELTTITKGGKLQKARFSDGLFRVDQGATLTDLTLTEALAPCPRRGRAAAAAKKPKTRKLWGDGHGAFRTTGTYSAATVRGTNWLVQDSCAGTLTRVRKGVVAVRDNVRRKTIVVRAGHKYLARPKRR